MSSIDQELNLDTRVTSHTAVGVAEKSIGAVECRFMDVVLVK